jgi:hypothetical protein
MARKIVNRKELRAEAEAAEKLGASEPAAKKKRAPRKTRAATVDIRIKLLWGVFNQSMKRVATFDYTDRDGADKKAAELSKDGKSPHFVQKVKEPVVD